MSRILDKFLTKFKVFVLIELFTRSIFTDPINYFFYRQYLPSRFTSVPFMDFTSYPHGLASQYILIIFSRAP